MTEMQSYEQRLLSVLRHLLLVQDPNIGAGVKRIHVEDVHLDWGQEEKLIVIVFREGRRPACLFGFCSPVYEIPSQSGSLDVPDPILYPDDPAEVWADMVIASLTEQIEAGDRGLPENCMDKGITWISGLVPTHE